MLFRKLRLDWRYGITELIIVVAGVLIALAADGWSQRQADRALELRYLHDLVLSSKMVVHRIPTSKLEVVEAFRTHTSGVPVNVH
jgi:hypothetical protein